MSKEANISTNTTNDIRFMTIAKAAVTLTTDNKTRNSHVLFCCYSRYTISTTK